MSEPMQIRDMKEFCGNIQTWLNDRYGAAQGAEIWEQTRVQYNKYLEEIPDYGGKKASHALATYGALVIFSLYPILPDQPPMRSTL